MKKIFVLSVFLGVFFTTGCGYTTRTTLPASIKTIHIDHIKNKIDFTAETGRNLYLPLIEVNVRNAIIERFQFDGNLDIMEEETADLLLKGELIGYSKSALRFTNEDDVQEYRVHVTVALTMWDNHKQDYAWVEPSFTGEGTYFVSGAQGTSEETAIKAAIADLARRIVERTVEDW